MECSLPYPHCSQAEEADNGVWCDNSLYPLHLLCHPLPKAGFCPGPGKSCLYYIIVHMLHVTCTEWVESPVMSVCLLLHVLVFVYLFSKHRGCYTYNVHVSTFLSVRLFGGELLAVEAGVYMYVCIYACRIPFCTLFLYYFFCFSFIF